MPKQTPALMIQGTCSNAGKSLLVAAFCRIFTQDGYNVAPFKAQNMALNSFVTDEGCEIGRAQALQAAACQRQPTVQMNPILLKPNSDTGSQVIVMGKPIAHMPVKEYIAYKAKAWESVANAYDTLADSVDIMVIEGAGSPAEINLKKHDIVNMAMAKYAKAKVLLCADIDRGGAFAALVGTMALLDETEQECVYGYILNKFRGDASLLHSALQDVSNMTKKPFAGVVPWIKELNLPDEDSVSYRLYGDRNVLNNNTKQNYVLDVALIDLPHISNFTDVDALRVEPDVNLRVVRNIDDLGSPDILILPGTKNTPSDLKYLYDSGLAHAILEKSDKIDFILGICGGLQLLGLTISDPTALESKELHHKGLGLLPLHTELLAQKTLRQCRALYKNKYNIEGYEIHHGCTSLVSANVHAKECEHVQAVIFNENNLADPIGWELNTKNKILGTYVHGALDNDEFRRALLDEVRVKKGLKPILKTTSYELGPSLDKLADIVRSNIDMKYIYALLLGK